MVSMVGLLIVAHTVELFLNTRRRALLKRANNRQQLKHASRRNRPARIEQGVGRNARFERQILYARFINVVLFWQVGKATAFVWCSNIGAGMYRLVFIRDSIGRYRYAYRYFGAGHNRAESCGSKTGTYAQQRQPAMSTQRASGAGRCAKNRFLWGLYEPV